MKTRFVKLLFLIILPILPFTGVTNAILSDRENADGNFFQASSLDLRLQNSDGSVYENEFFSEEKLETDTPITKKILVANTGSLNLEYWPQFEFTNGSVDVCGEITLKTTINGTEVYDDILSEFDLETQEQNLTQSGEDEWEFELTNENTDEDLQGESCDFDIIFTAFEDTDNQTGFSDTEILSNTLTLAYEPTLSLFHDNEAHHFVLMFGNLTHFEELSYELTYDTDTISDQAIHTEILTGENEKTFFVDLGTKSNDVLTPHSNPHNFDVTSELIDMDGHVIHLTEEL